VSGRIAKVGGGEMVGEGKMVRGRRSGILIFLTNCECCLDF